MQGSGVLGLQLVGTARGLTRKLSEVAGDRLEVIPARPVEAIDATGAGDTFDGAFLAEWLAHGDPFGAAAYANAAAALSTLGQGAVAPMPRREAVEAFLKPCTTTAGPEALRRVLAGAA